jgi:hypothetical protein
MMCPCPKKKTIRFFFLLDFLLTLSVRQRNTVVVVFNVLIYFQHKVKKVNVHVQTKEVMKVKVVKSSENANFLNSLHVS